MSPCPSLTSPVEALWGILHLYIDEFIHRWFRTNFSKLLLQKRDQYGNEGNAQINQRTKENKRKSLKEVYENKREEEEKARIEREASFKAKEEQRQRSEARRKDLRLKMLKKTKSGQPVMKYRVEHMLETLQGSTS